MAGFGSGYFANMVYSDPKWDFRTFDPVAGLAAAREKTSEALDATNPDLSAFAKRGGKLIMYHGWADAAISPLYSIHYYEEVQQKLGKDETASFTRLYLMPGVKHCADGPGPDSHRPVGPSRHEGFHASNNVIHALAGLGRRWQSARSHHRHQIRESCRPPRRPAQDPDDPPHLPLPAAGALQGHRQQQGSRILHLPVGPQPIRNPPALHKLLSRPERSEWGSAFHRTLRPARSPTIPNVSDQRKRTQRHAPQAHLPGRQVPVYRTIRLEGLSGETATASLAGSGFSSGQPLRSTYSSHAPAICEVSTAATTSVV